MHTGHGLADIEDLRKFAQSRVLRSQPVSFDGVGNRQLHFTQAERFQDVVVGAFFYRGARSLQRGESRHDDGNEGGANLASFTDELDAVHIRHHDIREQKDEIFPVTQ